MPRQTLPKTLILRGPATFGPHFERGHRETAGPLVGLALASDQPGTRVGFSVPRKVGNAVRRNRVRRLLREAFRLSHADHPAGVDLIVLVRAHEFKPLADYQAMLAKIFDRIKARQAKGPLPTRPTRPARPPREPSAKSPPP